MVNFNKRLIICEYQTASANLSDSTSNQHLQKQASRESASLGTEAAGNQRQKTADYCDEAGDVRSLH